MPGTPKICSITTEPVMTRGRRGPEVRDDRQQRRLQRVPQHDLPGRQALARAVRMKLLRSTSIMLPRVSRARYAICGSASATTGSTMLREAPAEPAGRQPAE